MGSKYVRNYRYVDIPDVTERNVPDRRIDDVHLGGRRLRACSQYLMALAAIPVMPMQLTLYKAARSDLILACVEDAGDAG